LFTIETSSAQETGQLGEKLGSLLGPGDIICLYGELGVGKTTFAQGVARGLDIEDRVTSPTFTLINEYYGRLPFFHMDAYRLDSSAEMADLGYEEYFYDGGVTLIEWAEKIKDLLPPDRLDITIDRVATAEDEDRRQVNLWPRGEISPRFVEELMDSVCPGD